MKLGSWDCLCGLASEFLATDPEVWVWFPAPPDFQRSSGAGTGSTRPREYNWGVTWKKKKQRAQGLEIREYSRRDPSRWPRGTFYPQKLALTSPASGCRSVSIVQSWTQTMEFFCCFVLVGSCKEGKPSDSIKCWENLVWWLLMEDLAIWS
jgi:hypothetical protein